MLVIDGNTMRCLVLLVIVGSGVTYGFTNTPSRHIMPLTIVELGNRMQAWAKDAGY